MIERAVGSAEATDVIHVPEAPLSSFLNIFPTLLFGSSLRK